MAVTIDTRDADLAGASGTTQQRTITVAANSNRCLFAILGSASAVDVSGVAFTSGSGGTWTKVHGVTPLEIWRCTAPSTGSVTVEATWPSSVVDRYMNLYSLYDVDQTTPAGGGVVGSAVNTLSATTGANDMGLFIWAAAANNPSPWSVGTETYANVFNIYWSSGHSTGSPSSTSTINTSTGTLGIGIAVYAPSAGGVVIPVRMAQTRMRTN